MPKFLTTENFYKFICGILLSITAFLLAQIFIKISDIERNTIELKIAVAKIQSESLTKDDVREIARYEIQKYHNK